MKNKRGIELSVNFIVTLILAIVVFGFGIYIVNKIYGTAADIEQQLDQDTEKQILQVLTDTNQPFTIPINRFELSGGGHKVVGVGISTYGVDISSSTSWHICVAASGTDKDDVSFSGVAGWTFPDTKLTVQSNEHRVQGLVFTVPRDAVKGVTYIFNVIVGTDSSADPSCSDSGKWHGRLQKVYLYIK